MSICPVPIQLLFLFLNNLLILYSKTDRSPKKKLNNIGSKEQCFFIHACTLCEVYDLVPLLGLKLFLELQEKVKS